MSCVFKIKATRHINNFSSVIWQMTHWILCEWNIWVFHMVSYNYWKQKKLTYLKKIVLILTTFSTIIKNMSSTSHVCHFTFVIWHMIHRILYVRDFWRFHWRHTNSRNKKMYKKVLTYSVIFSTATQKCHISLEN